MSNNSLNCLPTHSSNVYITKTMKLFKKIYLAPTLYWFRYYFSSLFLRKYLNVLIPLSESENKSNSQNCSLGRLVMVLSLFLAIVTSKLLELLFIVSSMFSSRKP